MKRNAFILAFLALTLSLTSFTLPGHSLVGKWKGEDGGEIGYITFDKKGYISFMVDGEIIGGKKYSSDGFVMDMYYETDETVTPHTIDFVIKLNEDQVEVARMMGIYKFVNAKTLIINMNFATDERPTMLDPEDENQITLTKIK